jgi:hypothetical protein
MDEKIHPIQGYINNIAGTTKADTIKYTMLLRNDWILFQNGISQ